MGKMNIANQYIDLCVEDRQLTVIRKDTKASLKLQWPAVSVSISGRKISPEKAISEVKAVSGNKLEQVFSAENLRFAVSLEIQDGREWFRKRTTINTDTDLPTPDFVEIDNQELPSNSFELCGYESSTPVIIKIGDEEGAGQMPGCGYPLIGSKFFVALEHPAGFNLAEKKRNREEISLRHYPVWENRAITGVSEVFGWSDDPREAFKKYFAEIRRPKLPRQMLAMGTFWSDPYLENFEYKSSLEGYEKWFKAFFELEVVPDIMLLDAGWNDLNSFLNPKRCAGGEPGLKKLQKLAASKGSSLGLWISHNGPVGINPGFLAEKGVPIGDGASSAYSNNKYGVMLDENFEKKLTERFTKLSNLPVSHFKIDWDNECATNPDFAEKYPSLHHVREASINAFFRIAEASRKKNPSLTIRNGWWPSPWLLTSSDHVFLPHSGDSEYSHLPSASQRERATTHRDIMYYNVLVRDRTALPLDVFDNHEFCDAPRNPFNNSPAEWCNTVLWSILRGTTYLTYNLYPDSLETWQAKTISDVLDFAHKHASSLVTGFSSMTGGDPRKGEIYGFMHPEKTESWIGLRNPLPFPQKLKLSAEMFGADHKAASIRQIYPDFRNCTDGAEIVFLPHEVKTLVLSSKKLPKQDTPFQVVKNDSGKYQYSFPALEKINDAVRPSTVDFQQVKELKCVGKNHKWKDNVCLQWFLNTPSRMRNATLNIRIKSKEKLSLLISTSRYRNHETGAVLALTEYPRGNQGYGEQRNSDVEFTDDFQFFSAKVPDGGEFNLCIKIEGGKITPAKISAWITGYEAPGRKSVIRKTPPKGFEEALPPAHPLGFPIYLELESR